MPDEGEELLAEEPRRRPTIEVLRERAGQILGEFLKTDPGPEVRREVRFDRSFEAWSRGLRKKLATLVFEVKDATPFKVELDAETGDVLQWRFPGASRGGARAVLGDDAIEKQATGILWPTEGAEFEGVFVEREPEGGEVARVRWRRVYLGMEVEGDYLLVRINPSTGEVATVARNWNYIPYEPPEGAKPLDEGAARQRAEALEKLGGKVRYEGGRKVWAKIERGGPEERTPFEVLPAWLLRFVDTSRPGARALIHEVAVHVYTGEILRHRTSG